MSPSSLSSSKIQPFCAELTVPGDKSISHRAAILGGLAEGTSRLENFLCSEDCLNTLKVMLALGAECQVEREDAFGRPLDFKLTGTNGKLQAPQNALLDCGNSGTGMRLLAGVLAAQPFDSTLTGDSSLCSRPMGRVIEPLSAMGAHLEPQGEKAGCAPLFIQGQKEGKLQALDYTLPMASAQVKSCVLLAGLFAQGTTTVHQPALTRDHTERLFTHFGVHCVVEGLSASVKGGQIPKANHLVVPGDISSAAFWMVAAAALPGSQLTLRKVGLNATRKAVIDVLLRMGADISFQKVHEDESGEPYGDLFIQGGSLQATAITPEEVPNLIDEIPILAVAGALASGTTILRHAKELRVKETDRVRTVVDNLRLMGGQVEEFEDGMEVTGGFPLTGCELESFGDHRIAMSFLVAGLFAQGTTTLHNTACIETSYPGFAQHLEYILKQGHA